MCRSQHTCRLTNFFEIIAKRAYTTIRDLRVVMYNFHQNRMVKRKRVRELIVGKNLVYYFGKKLAKQIIKNRN